MFGFDILPYFSRTLGKLCALRRVTQSLLSDLEEQRTLTESKERLEGIMWGVHLDTDLSSEAKDNAVLEHLKEHYKKDAEGSYDNEISGIVSQIEKMLEGSSKTASKED